MLQADSTALRLPVGDNFNSIDQVLGISKIVINVSDVLVNRQHLRMLELYFVLICRITLCYPIYLRHLHEFDQLRLLLCRSLRVDETIQLIGGHSLGINDLGNGVLASERVANPTRLLL